QIIVVQALVIHFTPKIEAYSQRTAIEYYKTFVGKDVYVYPLGFYSYAHLFYAKKSPAVNNGRAVEKYELMESADKPVYYITWLTKAEEYGKYPQLEETGRKGKYIFYRKK